MAIGGMSVCKSGRLGLDLTHIEGAGRDGQENGIFEKNYQSQSSKMDPGD